MFTGIIEEIGKVISPTTPLIIEAKKIINNLNVGDSVAVNGVCLTVTKFDKKTIYLDVMNETYSKTNLKELKYLDSVNLERAMLANGRFDGHIVSGHIDGVGALKDIKSDGNSKWLTISTNPEILKYIVLKGSVTLDGVSLTVAYVDDKVFKVSIIPHTQQITTLVHKKIGAKINIENDIISKYIEKFLTKPKVNIDLNYLIENGF